jgi:hypothetical protein
LHSPGRGGKHGLDQRHFAMKFAAIFSLLAIVLLVSPACEQQSYEETKMFNQKSSLKDGHSAHPEAGKAAEGGEKKHP